MLDINGQELREGALAQLLCEVLSITGDQILVRIMNSETELAVGVKHDEVLGGLVADSELVAFDSELDPFKPQHLGNGYDIVPDGVTPGRGEFDEPVNWQKWKKVPCTHPNPTDGVRRNF